MIYLSVHRLDSGLWTPDSGGLGRCIVVFKLQSCERERQTKHAILMLARWVGRCHTSLVSRNLEERVFLLSPWVVGGKECNVTRVGVRIVESECQGARTMARGGIFCWGIEWESKKLLENNERLDCDAYSRLIAIYTKDAW